MMDWACRFTLRGWSAVASSGRRRLTVPQFGFEQQAALPITWQSALVSVAKRLNLGGPIQVMPIDWAQGYGECRNRQARNGRFFRCGSELHALCQLGMR